MHSAPLRPISFMRFVLFKPVALAMLVFAASGLSLPLAAQETATQTPPELREFRLDPKPEPAPEKAEPTPAPVAAEPTPIVTPKPAPTKSAPPPKPKAAAATPTKVDVAPKAAPAEPLPQTDTNEIAAPTAAIDTLPALPSAETPAAKTESANESLALPALPALPNIPSWGWMIPLGLLAVGFAFWLFRRRKESHSDGDGPELDDAAASPAAALPPPLEIPPTVRLEANFVPEQAQLSMANLTISGRLSIRNLSAGPLRDMTVRTTMISASEGQREAIRKFHADENRGHQENIGDAKAGEEIALTLEIQQPRAELQAFDWRERQFLAPIVLIHLSSKGPKGIETQKLTCLIGREGDPESERMKPFHIDRGPRRFDQLGYHPIQI